MLAILTTHPIQYQTPIWKRLAERGKVPFRVFFMSRQGLALRNDSGFGRAVAWDVDLLSGYPNQFVDAYENEAQDSFRWLTLKRGFAQSLKAEGFTRVWIQGWQVAAYWQALWGAHGAGMETWLRAETNLRSRGGGRLAPVKNALLSRFLARINRFLYIGEANRAFYVTAGVAPDKLISAPYCIDNTRFRTQAAAARLRRADLRTQWRIPENAYCVLFVGKFVGKKRPVDLLLACNRLAGGSDLQEIHALYVGSGELGAAIRSHANVVFDAEVGVRSSEGLGPSASLAGFLNQTQISDAYAAADLLVLPSEAQETWGLVANEAMASGLPVVVSDQAGCSDDLVKPTRPDLVFATGDIDALASAISSAMRNPPLASDIETIIDRYDVDRTVDAVEWLYSNSMLNEQTPVAELDA